MFTFCWCRFFSVSFAWPRTDVGFDAVANSAEECRNPAKDIPVGIVASLGACALLYVAVVGVLAGMVPYGGTDEKAPLAAAFDAHAGMGWARALVDVGGLVGLATTLLVGLYAQSRCGRKPFPPPHHHLSLSLSLAFTFASSHTFLMET